MFINRTGTTQTHTSAEAHKVTGDRLFEKDCVTDICPVCVRVQERLREIHVWDAHTQTQRRKVVFTGLEEEEDDVSGSSSDEDDDGSDQENQEEEDDLSTFLKEVRDKSEKATKGSTPPVKKRKLEEMQGEEEVIAEAPAFADSEDELERGEADSEGEGEAERAGDSGHCSKESEEDSDDEEDGDEDDESMEEEIGADDSDEEEEQGKYHTTHSGLFTFSLCSILC